MRRLLLATAVLGVSLTALGAKSPSASLKHFQASAKKSGSYTDSGFFSGGDRTVSSATLKDIRRGPQAGGVERIVLDLDSHGTARDKVPFFQVNVSPDEGRLLVSLWADVNYDVDTAKIENAFRKSAHVAKVNVIPRVEDGLATIELVLNNRPKGHTKVEAFYLTHPGRIILDLL